MIALYNLHACRIEFARDCVLHVCCASVLLRSKRARPAPGQQEALRRSERYNEVFQFSDLQLIAVSLPGET